MFVVDLPAILIFVSLSLFVCLGLALLCGVLVGRWLARLAAAELAWRLAEATQDLVQRVAMLEARLTVRGPWEDTREGGPYG